MSERKIVKFKTKYENAYNKSLNILQGDALTRLKGLPSCSIHCCVTSPPYYMLRNYGKKEQLGQEKTLQCYINRLINVFDEALRVLHPSGTLWLNLGDTYVNSTTSQATGLKPKNLALVPERIAIAMQERGWYLRSKIIWLKKTPMPESVKDRPTSAWEPIFLFTKSPKYFFDNEAIKEPSIRTKKANRLGKKGNKDRNDNERTFCANTKRNMRNVLHLSHEPYKGTHFAPFPSAIPRTAILAGTSEKGCCPKCLSQWQRITKRQTTTPMGDIYETITVGWEPTCSCGHLETQPCNVLDVFAGSGTTGQVALELGRKTTLIELNPDYCDLIRSRCEPLLQDVDQEQNSPTTEKNAHQRKAA